MGAYPRKPVIGSVRGYWWWKDAGSRDSEGAGRWRHQLSTSVRASVTVAFSVGPETVTFESVPLAKSFWPDWTMEEEAPASNEAGRAGRAERSRMAATRAGAGRLCRLLVDRCNI